MTKQNELFRIIFLCKEKVVDNCLVLCCLRFRSCNPQRVTSANFPVICLKFTSWKWKVNHLHALMYNYTCTGVTVAKHFDLKGAVVSQGDSCSSLQQIFQVALPQICIQTRSLVGSKSQGSSHPPRHIWLNFNSLSMTVTKKICKINLPSS